MSESGKGKARLTRQERLSAAMRENLKRRKAQARGRGAQPKPDEAGGQGTGPRKGA